MDFLGYGVVFFSLAQIKALFVPWMVTMGEAASCGEGSPETRRGAGLVELTKEAWPPVLSFIWPHPVTALPGHPGLTQ